MPSRILLAVRLGEAAEAATAEARRLARALGGEIVLLYVAVELETVPHLHATTGVDEEELQRTILREVEERLGAFAAEHLEGVPVHLRVAQGDVPTAVVEASVREDVNYIVIGMEGRGPLLQLIIGSTAQEILRRAPRPVLVVPHPHP